ncbi:SDR family oxidoreductase [Bradyrhizobium erythrophlei]|uniref:SDR family oxidoreductase n=1 Tax=Bradyrhizobium erythrophlei TaxID=1437360 RepID=UPI0035EA74CB
MEEKRRVVIVTGAAGGIGRALLDAFHRGGDIIAAVDLPSTNLLDITAALGPEHVGFHCDVASEDEVVSLVAAIERRFGRIDVLVNNAALGPTMAATVDTDIASFRRTLSVNLRGPVVLAREAARRMLRRGGVIVNVASLAGVLGNPKRNAYAASKAGLISATRLLAYEWAKHGIRVVAVAPGYIRTPMVAELERSGRVNLEFVRRRVPLGRMGHPDEIAAVVRFLASPAAGYVTGTVLAVDGGWQSFNQPGDAYPPIVGTPDAELSRSGAMLRERIVVVIGADCIGEAIGQKFASAGDMVVVADKDSDRLAEVVHTLGPKHKVFGLDASSEQGVLALFTAIRQRFGRLDVLVNNAAVADSCPPALQQSAADIDKFLEVNVVGVFLCAREAIKLMGDDGVILNVASIDTSLPFAPGHAYGASRAAIGILTRCMAAELGRAGVRTATIAQGCIRTPGMVALQASGRIDAAKIRRRIPLGRFGEPAEVANAAYFLASPEASYINGSAPCVDGGLTSFGDAGDASAACD